MKQNIYEAIRWIISIFLPAFTALIVGLAMVWNWNFPTEAFSATMSLIETFLGAIFIRAKLKNDKA